MTKGEISPNLYFVLHGKMLVTSDIDDDSPIASLQKLDYFGESSVLNYVFGPSGVGMGPTEAQKALGISLFADNDRTHSELKNLSYLECCSAKAATAVDLLVFSATHFNLLLNPFTINTMKSAFISRMQWRMDRSDTVYHENRKISLMKARLLHASAIAAASGSAENGGNVESDSSVSRSRVGSGSNSSNEGGGGGGGGKSVGSTRAEEESASRVRGSISISEADSRSSRGLKATPVAWQNSGRLTTHAPSPQLHNSPMSGESGRSGGKSDAPDHSGITDYSTIASVESLTLSTGALSRIEKVYNIIPTKNTSKVIATSVSSKRADKESDGLVLPDVDDLPNINAELGTKYHQ